MSESTAFTALHLKELLQLKGLLLTGNSIHDIMDYIDFGIDINMERMGLDDLLLLVTQLVLSTTKEEEQKYLDQIRFWYYDTIL